jgi:hypothetical protein
MTPGVRASLRREVLRRQRPQAEEAAMAEVLAYGESPFQAPEVAPPVLPQPEEPHVADWRAYGAEAGEDLPRALGERLVQLQVPVRDGVSQTAAYAEVTRRGAAFREEDFGGRLALRSPAALRLTFHEHPAGALPVLTTADRQDFETLVQALAFRNEPKPIGPAVNAQLVSGLLNWDRVGRCRAAFSAGRDPLRAAMEWPGELARLGRDERHRISDRLLVTCARPYSGVAASELGLPLSEAAWLERSIELRIEHEFTHYATKRVFGRMSLNLLDETLCDLMGMTHALGRFEAKTFLRFLGLDAFPEVRADGRVRTYASELSLPAFELLCAVTVAAAEGVEGLCARFYAAESRARFLLALAPLTLELLASAEAPALFAESWEQAGRWTGAA